MYAIVRPSRISTASMIYQDTLIDKYSEFYLSASIKFGSRRVLSLSEQKVINRKRPLKNTYRQTKNKNMHKLAKGTALYGHTRV